MSIKYYRLAKDEEPPEEFCAVCDVNGEPSEYTWYERMSNFERELWVLFTQSDWFAGSEYRKLQAENAKLREELEAAKHDLSLFSGELVASKFENDKLRELVRDIYSEYRYLRVRFHRTYLQHEERMRAIEQRMRELGLEAGE